MESTRYSCQIVMKDEFPRRDFLKSSNIKFHENLSSGSKVLPYRRRDRRNEQNGLFTQFCERAQEMKNNVLEMPAQFFFGGMNVQ